MNRAIILMFIVFLMAVFPAAAGPPGPGDGPPPMVTVAVVTEQDVNPPAEYVGHVEAVQTVNLRARVEGFLEQVNFKEGSNVCVGDLLYVIEQALYKAKVNADTARVAQFEATLGKAGRRLKRLQAALPESVPATDMDNAMAEELRVKAQLQEAQADLEQSKLDLGYTRIWAPINGRIGRTAHTKGNLVNLASGTLASIVQINPIRVVYSISENDFAMIKMSVEDSVGSKKRPMLALRIKLPGGQIMETEGQIDFTDNTVDIGTGTIAVRALFDNTDGMLLPGQYVTVMVTRSKPELMPVMPQSAVLEDSDGRYVLVVDGRNKVSMRRVKTGPVIGVNWAVASGLNAGEKVIVEGVQKVHPGQIVKTVTPDNQNENER